MNLNAKRDVTYHVLRTVSLICSLLNVILIIFAYMITSCQTIRERDVSSKFSGYVIRCDVMYYERITFLI